MEPGYFPTPRWWIAYRLIRTIATILGLTYTIQYASEIGTIFSIPIAVVLGIEILGQLECFNNEFFERVSGSPCIPSSIYHERNVEVNVTARLQAHAFVVNTSRTVGSGQSWYRNRIRAWAREEEPNKKRWSDSRWRTREEMSRIGGLHVHVLGVIQDLSSLSVLTGGNLLFAQYLKFVQQQEVQWWWMLPFGMVFFLVLGLLVLWRWFRMGCVPILTRLIVDAHAIVSDPKTRTNTTVSDPETGTIVESMPPTGETPSIEGVSSTDESESVEVAG